MNRAVKMRSHAQTHSRRRRGAFPATLLLVTALAGCHGQPAEDRSTPVPPATAPATTPAIRTASRFPDTSLSLGGVTMIGPNAMALISVENRAQEPYTAGQEITNGITLSAIYADHVVVKYRDSLKILRLKGRANARFSPADATEAHRFKDPLMHPETVKSDGTGGTEDFLREVRVTPHYAGGFLIHDIDTGSIYDKLGVLPGDVVYSLDMLTLVKLEELSTHNARSDAKDIRLEVVRAGERVPLKYRFEARE